VTREPQQDTRATRARATRRGVLAGVGLVGLAGAVSACGSGGSSSSSAAPNTGAPQATGAGSVPSSASGGPASGGSTSGAQALATTSEIPVGGGKIFATEKVVVTQPTANDFKAFSAVCTHMGCIVATISDGTIDCPCHGSKYSIKNGAVVNGPAPSPLAAEPIKVTGSNIFLS
jgi:Rieske Fe-S protein